MGLEHVLLVDDVVTVDHIARLVAGDQELLVIGPGHRHDTLSMNIALLYLVEILGVPYEHLALVRTCDDSFAVLHPLTLKERYLLLGVLTLANIT